MGFKVALEVDLEIFREALMIFGAGLEVLVVGGLGKETGVFFGFFGRGGGCGLV